MTTRTWHACRQCGHQCPHDDDYCRCPWCLWMHDIDASGPRIDPTQDGDGRVHPQLMDEFTCRMATIAGLLRVVSGRAGIVYTGEHQVRLYRNPNKPVDALTFTHTTGMGPNDYAIESISDWLSIQEYIAPLGQLGTIHYGEDLAA